MDAPARLIAAGRALLAQGDERFSLSRLCAEAGVTLADFRASFTSRAELLQQLMDMPRPEAPAADPWLERRLRVFERALNGLEEKAEQRDREYRQTIARMEEKLATLGGMQLRLEVAAAGQRAQAPEEAAPGPAPEMESLAELPDPDERAEEPHSLLRGPLLLEPLEPAPPTKVDAEFLEGARRAAQAHGRSLKGRRKPPRLPTRMLVIAALAVLALLACAALTLVYAEGVYAGYTPPPSGGAVAHRAAVLSPMISLTARADNGDVAAQRALALAYLRGEGVEKNLDAAARWAEVAAGGGDPEAQYLFGSLNRSGAGVVRNPAAAFTWFMRAASAGHLKAMHSLAIAYVEGLGTPKNESAAASWFGRAAMQGYVDAAFNLAVLYERGHGVTQNPQLALRWYRAAAKAGDKSAAARARTLAQQAGL